MDKAGLIRTGSMQVVLCKWHAGSSVLKLPINQRTHAHFHISQHTVSRPQIAVLCKCAAVLSVHIPQHRACFQACSTYTLCLYTALACMSEGAYHILLL